jgi:hypothetical protein
MPLVGREADLKYLEDKMKNSPRHDTRERAKLKIQEIRKEGNSKMIAQLRHRLIQAERKDDAAEAEKVRQAIRRETA